MGIREGGRMALLGCAGPMGLGAIDYAVNGPRRPSLVVVTDIDQDRLDRAQQLITPEQAAEAGVTLHYVNTSGMNAHDALMAYTDGKGYDDVFVFAPVAALVEQGDDILANDGCLNFFSGPTDHKFKVPFNFYNVHYESTHIVGTSGGSTGDMVESLELSSEGRINPSYMVTHIGGIDAAPETILNLPHIPGGKKVIYPHIELPLTAIADFGKLAAQSELFAGLHAICSNKNDLWCEEAESFLLDYYHVAH